MKKNNKYFYNKLIKFLVVNIYNYKYTKSLRDTTIRELMIKYTRILRVIKKLEFNEFHRECFILIKSLLEIVLDIGYLELNVEDYYYRYDFYNNYKLCELLREKGKCSVIDPIRRKANMYSNHYNINSTRWSGISLYKESIKLDKKHDYKISFNKIYSDIDRINNLNNFSKIIYINKAFNDYKIDIDNDFEYFLNLYYIILLTKLLKEVCIPDFFTKDTDIFNEFDEFLESIKIK